MGKHFYYLWGSISSGKLAMSLYTMTITLLIFTITNSATFASLVMLIYVIGKIVSSFIFPFVTEKIPLKKILCFSLLAQFAFILYFISSIAAAFTFRRESKNYDAMNDVNN